MNQLWTMTASDLRQRIRDKSVIIFGLIVPLALMFVFNLVFGGVQNQELKPITVAAAVPAGDQIGETLVEALGRVPGLDVTVTPTPAEQVRERVESGSAQAGVIIPADFTARVTAGEDASVELIEGGGGIEGQILVAVARGALNQIHAGAVAATAAGQSGIPPDRLAAIAQQAATAGPVISLTEGQASREQLTASGALVAGQAGLFLLFTVGFGVLALIQEREIGTMPRLRSMPMRPGRIVTAKALVGFILGVVATSVLLIAGSLLFSVDFGSIIPVAALILCAVAAATSLTFIVARLAANAEQANTMQSILALVLGIAGGAFFPVVATGLLGALLDLNPISAFIRGLGITSGGGGITDIGVPVVIMLGFAVVCLAISFVVPDRGREL